VKAGLRLDIVLEADLQKDRAIARKAMVYDVFDDRFLISQTSPPLYRRHIGERVNASYLVTVGSQESKRAIRMGVPATVAEYLKAYPLSSSNFAPAFVLKQEGKAAKIDLRMHYRVRPTASSDLTLLANGEKVNLIDISMGGVQFSLRLKNPPLEYGNVALTLQSGGRMYPIDGTVTRISNPMTATGRVHDLEYVTARFVGLDRDVEFFLGKKILMIERQLISEGKILPD